MRNLADVLRQKETELQTLEREIEALRLAARLCSEDGDVVPSLRAESAAAPKPIRGVSLEEPTRTMKQFP
jgi:hypothetical protein